MLLLLSYFCWRHVFSHPCCYCSHIFADGTFSLTRAAPALMFLLTASFLSPVLLLLSRFCWRHVFSHPSSAPFLTFFTDHISVDFLAAITWKCGCRHTVASELSFILLLPIFSVTWIQCVLCFEPTFGHLFIKKLFQESVVGIPMINWKGNILFEIF